MTRQTGDRKKEAESIQGINTRHLYRTSQVTSNFWMPEINEFGHRGTEMALAVPKLEERAAIEGITIITRCVG